MSAFTVENGVVVMDTTSGPIRLRDPRSVEALLDIFIWEGEAAAFNELHDAYRKAGGIARPTIFREVA